jgi:hypothetical protein
MGLEEPRLTLLIAMGALIIGATVVTAGLTILNFLTI